METVVLDGREYTKASVIAKRFKYTSDYVGQLCRSKKVDARLVGRTWFLNIDSLESHRSQRYASLKEKNSPTKQAPVGDMASKKYARRVPAPLRAVGKSVQTFSDNGPIQPREASVTYEPDDFSLLPQVHRSAKITLLKVAQADAEKVSVNSESPRLSKLTPEPLPSVYLKGYLKVNDITDPDIQLEKEVASEKNSVSRDNKENKAENEIVKVNQITPRTLKVKIKRVAPAKVTPASQDSLENRAEKKSSNLKITQVDVISPEIELQEVAITNLEQSPDSGFSIPIFAYVAVAAVVSFFLLSTENVLTVTASTMSSNLSLEASLLLSLFAL